MSRSDDNCREAVGLKNTKGAEENPDARGCWRDASLSLPASPPRDFPEPREAEAEEKQCRGLGRNGRGREEEGVNGEWYMSPRQALLTKWTYFASALATAFAIPEVETPRWRVASARESPSRRTRRTASCTRTAESRRRSPVRSSSSLTPPAGTSDGSCPAPP
jgi:hypothetical protein